MGSALEQALVKASIGLGPVGLLVATGSCGSGTPSSESGTQTPAVGGLVVTVAPRELTRVPGD